MQQISWRALANELLFGLLALIIGLVCISFGYAMAWPLQIDIGASDSAFVRHFGEPEQGNAQSFRWTLDGSTLVLPPPPLHTATILSLQIEDSRQIRPAQPHLLLRADGHDLFSVPLRNQAPGTYTLLLPPLDRPARSLLVELQTETMPEDADGRLLGVVLFDVLFTPTNGWPWLPPAWVTFCAICCGLCAYLLARLLNLGSPWALLLVAVFALLVAVALVARPSDILPFLQRFPALLGIAALGVGIARLLAPPSPQGVAGTYLPIYLAVGMWMLLLYQIFMLWDGATGIGPALWDRWIAGGAATLLGIGLPVWSFSAGRQLSEDDRRARRADWALMVLSLAAAAHIGFSIWYGFTRQAPDFWILFKGARNWVQGGSLYNLDDVLNNHFAKVFKVPPFYGMFFVPFVLTMGGEVLLFWHRVMNMVLVAGVGLVWLRMWRLPLVSPAGASLLIVLSFRPLFDTLSYGQIDLVLLFILTLTLWALRAERDLLAGVLVALATLFKIYPVVLLAFFVIKRQWRGLWGFALGMLIFNGIAVAVMGWEMHRIYLTQVIPNIGGTTAWIENQTISGFFARLGAEPTNAIIFVGRELQLAGTFVAGLVVLAVCGLSLQRVTRQSTAYALHYSLFLLVMVLCVPAAWMHYQTLLVVVFAAILLHLRTTAISLRYAVALGLSFGLIAYGNQWSFFGGTTMGMLTWIGFSYKLYGMLLLGGLVGGRLLWERRLGRETQ